MALLNKRSRNIEGLLASRLGDQDAPRKIQDRGKHGALMSGNKVRYGTKGQEGRNFLKAVDKYHNYKDWNKDLGGGQNFMQGSGQDYSDLSDPIIKKAKDKQNAMLDAQMTDKGSVGEAEGAEAASLFEERQSVYGVDDLNQKGPREDTEGESVLDRIGAENRGRAAAMADFGDEEGGGFWNEVKGLFDSDSIGTPKEEGYRDVDTEGDNRYLNKLAREEYALGQKEKQGNKTISELHQEYIDATPGQDTEGESELDRIGRENMLDAMGDLGPDKMEKPGESIDQTSIFDGLFSSDDEGGGKKKKKMSKEAMKYGADLMKGMMQEPSQGQRQMPTSKVTRGSVPFAGLLAQKAPRQRNPYFTPKGLV